MSDTNNFKLTHNEWRQLIILNATALVQAASNVELLTDEALAQDSVNLCDRLKTMVLAWRVASQPASEATEIAQPTAKVRKK